MGVHFYLYSDDVSEVNCPHDNGNAPGLGKALCHAVSDADGMFTFTSIPCGTTLYFSAFSPFVMVNHGSCCFYICYVVFLYYTC